MIVIGILSLLVAVVASRYFHAVDVSEVTTTEAQLKLIANAVEQYRVDKHTYPGTMNVATAIDSRLFGGFSNDYMIGTPRTPNGSQINYYLGGFIGTKSEYLIQALQLFDGSLLAAANLLKVDGTIPAAGTQYYITFDNARGMLAY